MNYLDMPCAVRNAEMDYDSYPDCDSQVEYLENIAKKFNDFHKKTMSEFKVLLQETGNALYLVNEAKFYNQLDYLNDTLSDCCDDAFEIAKRSYIGNLDDVIAGEGALDEMSLDL